MASLEEAMVTVLEADATVSAAALGGVHPEVLPPGVAMPAIRFLTVSELPVMATDGPSGTRRVRVQVDVFARAWPDAHALAEAVRAVLCPSPNERRTVGSVVIDGVIPELGRSGYELATKLYRYSRDFIMWGGLTA